jgi:hypothetical protein
MSGVARRSISIVTQPTTEPITVTDAKLFAKIDTGDDDITVTALITAARMAAEEFLRKTLMPTTLKMTLDLSGGGLYDSLGAGTYEMPVTALYGSLPRELSLPKGPLSSVTSVVTYALDNTASTFDPSNITSICPVRA